MKHQVYLLDNTSETDYSNIDADNIVLLVDNSISISDDTQVSLDGKVDKVSGSSLIEDTSIIRLADTSGENTGDQDLSGKLDKNTTITPDTKTKITYDADGLVTEGDDATTEDINDSTDRRYLTDTQKTEATRNATTSQNGLISSTDWNTFNDKQGAGNYEPAFTKNTAFNKDFGTTAGTIPQGNEVLRTSDALTEVTDTNKLITVEDYGGLIYISQWNPTTNTPTLADADATKFREAYISLNDFTRFGIDWEKGDYLVYDINGDIFREENPLKNIVSTVGFSNDYDDLDNLPTIKRTKKPISTATYTFEASDANKYIEFSAECVATVPDGFPADLEFQGEQVGTGALTFEASTTLNVFYGFLKETAGQHAVFGIRTKGSNIATLIGTLKLA